MTNDLKMRLRTLVSRGERGATAVVVAISMVLLFAAGAVGFDIARLANSRQQVRAAIDAAAQAAAMDLPGDTSAAIRNANTFAHANMAEIPDGGLTIKFYCVVANKSGVPDESQIPTTCNPGVKGSDWTVAGSNCTSAKVCAIPVDMKRTPSAKPNTLSVSYDLAVDFIFGPAIGISAGSTGNQSTLSCIGTCGGQASPNPMDIVVMADRTPSMSSSEMTALRSGLSNMLTVMNPDQQYVALGTLGKSKVASSGCLTLPDTTSVSTWKRKNPSWYTSAWPGVWVQVPFQNNYLTTTSSGTKAVNTSSSIGRGISSSCLKNDTAGWSTNLAAALKGGARYLYGSELGSSNNLSSLPDRSELKTEIKKVLILETDGEPVEPVTMSPSALSLRNNIDIGQYDTPTACQNLIDMARQVKQMKNALVITVGYGTLKSYGCGTMSAAEMLAAVASPKDSSNPSRAQVGCATQSARNTENSDGDWFFCAATASELENIFSAAVGQATGTTKYMSIDGIGN